MTTFSGLGGVSLHNVVYYLHLLDVLLTQLVYAFVLSYPMMVFPFDVYRKYGFNGPIGLFVDSCTSGIVQHFLGEQNVHALQQQLRPDPEVKSFLTQIEEMTDLTDDELEVDWAQWKSHSKFEGEVPNRLADRITLAKAHSRSLGWALNYVLSEVNDGLSDKEATRQWRLITDW